MPSVNVGSASVTIMPSMSGFAAKVNKGLGSAGSGQGTESSGTVTAPTYDPSQDSGESDDFDWSQIQSEFDSLKDEFPS